MLRFFEPELLSSASLDRRASNWLGFALESKVPEMRNDGIFPLLSSPLISNNFARNNEERARNSLEILNSYNGSFQLNTLIPSPPSVNPIPGQASAMGIPTNHPMDIKPTNLTNSKHSTMTTSRRKQRKHTTDQTSMHESKRQKGACEAKRQNPSFDVLGVAKKSQKLGDKITALQQLVSPFGKTDTASVLQEATLCIQILHDQIRMLASPYFGIEASPSLLLCNGGIELGIRDRGLCLAPISSITECLNNRDERVDPCNIESMGYGKPAFVSPIDSLNFKRCDNDNRKLG